MEESIDSTVNTDSINKKKRNKQIDLPETEGFYLTGVWISTSRYLKKMLIERIHIVYTLVEVEIVKNT